MEHQSEDDLELIEHPDIAVLVPTPDGIRRASVGELMPHAYVWTPDDGSRPVPG
jgi:hypothetical protein